MRVVRKWEDQMLLREIAEVEEHYETHRNPSAAAYAAGLRTAAMLLGAIKPEFHHGGPPRAES